MSIHGKKEAVVVGGGVAGITAATLLAEAGIMVRLIEKRPLLGGRASSYLDVQTGERVDECQHGTLRCCTHLAALFTRLGISDQLRYFDSLTFIDGDGKLSNISSSWLPAPLHTSISFLIFKSLKLKDKTAIANGMLHMLRSPSKPDLDNINTAQWFKATGQTERAISRFWRPILVSACNEEPEFISCRHSFKVFRDAFLANRNGFHFGVPTKPLASLYTEPTIKFIEDRGGCVQTRTTVVKLNAYENGINSLMLQGGESICADGYIVTLQCDLIDRIIPAEIIGINPGYWEHLKDISLVPIMGVHLWFKETIDCPPALALLDRKMEWIFNRSLLYKSAENAGTFLSLVVSASRNYEGIPKDEIVKTALQEIHEVLPDTASFQPTRTAVVRWPRATLSPRPGVDGYRPGTDCGADNLFIAGEWTNTGWPSTMEGAARSGYEAATALLTRWGFSPPAAIPDLPVEGLSKFLLRKWDI